MSTHTTVIVESPAKAKTINKYLGKDYTVLASFGHVRDLPSKDGSVDPEKGFAMTWQLDSRGKKTMKEIGDAVKKSDAVILATDPDREGEAIAWHVKNVLEEKKLLKDKTVERVTFNQITKKAVQDAFAKPRTLDQSLIDAYLARRALDYLVGFGISPVLWRKLPGSRSAGRVQSVALRLVCERESEIEAFDPREYWSITGTFLNKDKKAFPVRLTHFDGEKLGKFAIENEARATEVLKAVTGLDYTVTEVSRKQVTRNPAAPFITSTLQQDASRKLGFGASRTMSVAQRLYEAGHITYMRTDGPTLSGEAISQARSVIGEDFGADYVPKSPRQYKSKAKNAQEAHEAIRPVDIIRRPASLAKKLEADQLKLYTLIWKRTVASQMASAKIDQLGVNLQDSAKKHTFRATGSSIAFPGFIAVYMEGRDEDGDREKDAQDSDDGKTFLPDLKEGEAVTEKAIEPNQHFTQPPPRFTEATLVKKLEELGIGRPSTYASILKVLQDRDYVRLESKRFFAEDRGRIVTAFLEEFFDKYVEYDFTAELENKLDAITRNEADWQKLLAQFWEEFKARLDGALELRIQDVINHLNGVLADLLFPLDDDATAADKKARRECPTCKAAGRENGVLSLKLGKYGAFIGCSNYPECNYTRKLGRPEEGDVAAAAEAAGMDLSQPHELGTDPETGKAVTLRKGPYGVYVQLGEPEGKGKAKTKPKRASLKKGMNPQDIDLAKALDLLQWPRLLGEHPETGDVVDTGIGRYGPYVRYQKKYIKMPEDFAPETITLDEAVEVIATAPEKKPRGGAKGKRKPAAKGKKKAAAKKK